VNERDLTDFGFERGEEFLGHPRATQQPSALGAVLNFNS
jgi:hypothetical protein